MCEQCTCNEEFTVEDYEQVESSYENSFLPPVEIDLDTLFTNESFAKGISDYAYICGAITALVNVGIHPSEALNYLGSKDSTAHNLEVAKIQKEMNVECSKNNAIMVDKQQL